MIFWRYLNANCTNMENALFAEKSLHLYLYLKSVFNVAHTHYSMIKHTLNYCWCLVVFSTEYCAGFVDVHGQWNNGFYCPKWGDPDVPYCCGDEHERYCCTSTQHPHPYRRQQQQSHRQPHYHHQQLTDQPPTDVYSSTLSFHGAQHATEPIYYQ